MSVQPFDVSPVCRKCGHTTISVRHCTYSTCTYELPVGTEHLDRTCQRCGWSWVELCMDASKPKCGWPISAGGPHCGLDEGHTGRCVPAPASPVKVAE